MKRITYAGEMLVTSDDIADALTELATAFGTVQKSVTVEIPIFDEDGSSEAASLVLGPASELVAVPAERPGTEPDTTATVAELQKMKEALVLRHPVPGRGPGTDLPRPDPAQLNQL